MLLLLLLVLAWSWYTSLSHDSKAAAGASKAADILYGLSSLGTCCVVVRTFKLLLAAAA
jgi:hypothetical protein